MLIAKRKHVPDDILEDIIEIAKNILDDEYPFDAGNSLTTIRLLETNRGNRSSLEGTQVTSYDYLKLSGSAAAKNALRNPQGFFAELEEIKAKAKTYYKLANDGTDKDD